MGISRLSTESSFSQMMYNLRLQQSTMNTLNQQIASGKKIQKPSDDPIGITQLLTVQLDSAQNTQYGKNIDNALGEMNVASSAISSIIQVAQRAQTLATQAANSTTGSDQLAAIGQEVNSMMNNLTQIGNTTYAGHYIFSGFATNASAFTASGDDIVYNGTANTDTYQRQVQVGKNTFVTVNINGQDLLGSAAVTGGTADGSGLFQAITQFKLDLQSQDHDAIRADLGKIQEALQSIQTQQAKLGGTINQVQSTQDWLSQVGLNNAKQTSQLQDIDLAESISNLSMQQTLYQASIRAMSGLLQSSLVNYIQ